MRLRREASLGIGAILGLQILLSVLTITLLMRMGPAIEKILQENVYSEAAIEEMLSTLATTPATRAAGIPTPFDEALSRALANVTEAEERPLLKTIEEKREAAFAGDPLARAELVATLQRLGEVNRQSMTRADAQAKRLSQAGAWAAAMLGAFTMGLGVLVYRRMRLHLEMPIEELRLTVQRVREGNRQARCPRSEGPIEVVQIANTLNWILDESLHQRRPAETSQREADVRRALALQLDEHPGPVWILDEGGHTVASNQQALDQTPPEGGQPIPGTSLKRVLGPSGAGCTAERADAPPPRPDPENEL